MSDFRGNRQGEQGFSLTELIVVIAIIGILLGLATLNFHQWQVKNNVESQVRQMVSDMSESRVRAFTMKERQSITLNQSSYVLRSYSSDDEPKCSSGPDSRRRTISVPYQLKKDPSTYFQGTCPGETFEIDQRGMLVGSLGDTIYLEYTDASPVLDCLTIHLIRINPGKRNAGGTCDDK